MKGLHALIALFAAFMLVRHVPRAVSLLGGRGQGSRAMGIVSVVNVVLALALLVVAVKGLL